MTRSFLGLPGSELPCCFCGLVGAWLFLTLKRDDAGGEMHKEKGGWFGRNDVRAPSSVLYSFPFNVSQWIHGHRSVMNGLRLVSSDIKKFPRFVSKPVSEGGLLGGCKWNPALRPVPARNPPFPFGAQKSARFPATTSLAWILFPRFGATSGGILQNTQ